MIGSPDLLTFTTDPDVPEAPPEAAGLPEELSVPLYPTSLDASPWSAGPGVRFERDFILVSEFSEQVGPLPLLTIPDDPKACGGFDLNHFSLRVMSADYQTAFACPSGGAAYPRLNFVEDSGVVLGHSQEGAHAYVHHLTLYDLEARGFVRPFCMAYVSGQEGKLMGNFRRLAAEFSRAAECLKTGNRKNFANELDGKLADLEYTRLVLLRELERDGTIGPGGRTTAGAAPGREKAAELARLGKAIQEHRSLLKQVASFPNRRLKDPDFLPYDPGDGPQPLTEDDLTGQVRERPACSRAPKLVRASLCCRFDRPLKSLEQLCDEYFLRQTLKQLRYIEKGFRGDGSDLLRRRVAQSLLPRLHSTSFLFEHLDSETGQASAWVETPGFPWPGRSEPGTLEPYSSCVETVPIRLGADGSGPSDACAVPVNSSVGSVGSGDSIEVLGIEKSYARQGSRETPEPVPLAPVVYFDPRKRRAATRRENSQDSIEVLSTTDSIVLDDLRASCPSAISEETPEQCLDCHIPAMNPDLDLDSRTFGALSPPDDLSDCFSSYSFASTTLGGPQDDPSTRRRKRGKTGRAALQFLRQFPFAAHAVYSLLSGRTLVVLGSDETAVRHWVTGLTLYTPRLGKDRESVRPWTTGPLQITDLLTWKLVGLSRTAWASSPSVSLCLSRYSRYLSVLDVDQRTLRCPAYGGSLICPLVEPGVHAMRGTAYFLYAQCSIGQLVSGAFLLTFSRDWAGRVRRRFHPHDLKILGYLSELIVRNVTGTPPTTLGFSYSACTKFKL